MGHADEVLIVPLAHARFLFPERILADDECADALGYQQINDASAGRVQVVVNLPRTMGSEPLQLRRGAGGAGGAGRAGRAELVLQLGPALVIELVERLDGAT